MNWLELSLELFGADPTDRTSREVSVQDVLVTLIVGRKPAWFEEYRPTGRGESFLIALWRAAFGSAPSGGLAWFVSEHSLPVPPEWRHEIGLPTAVPISRVRQTIAC